MKRKSEDDKGELFGEDKKKFIALSDCYTEEVGSVSAETYETNKRECLKEVGKINANKGHIKSILSDTYNNRYIYIYAHIIIYIARPLNAIISDVIRHAFMTWYQ